MRKVGFKLTPFSIHPRVSTLVVGGLLGLGVATSHGQAGDLPTSNGADLFDRVLLEADHSDGEVQQTGHRKARRPAYCPPCAPPLQVCPPGESAMPPATGPTMSPAYPTPTAPAPYSPPAQPTPISPMTPPTPQPATPSPVDQLSTPQPSPEFSQGVQDALTPAPAAPPSTSAPAATSSAPASSFGAGLGGGTLLASRNVPAMIGDFFGSGQSTFVVPRLTSMIIPAAANPGSPFFDDDGNAFFSGNSGPELMLDAVVNVTGTGSHSSSNTSSLSSSSSSSLYSAPTVLTLGESAAISSEIAAQLGYAAFVDGEALLLSEDSVSGLSSGDQYDLFFNYLVPELDADGNIQLDSVQIPDVAAPDLVVGRQRISENTSPIPRDRVFMNYSLFDGVPFVAGGRQVNRFSPGVEKTFNGGLSSLEVRVPFAATLDSNQPTDGMGSITNSSNVELGSVTAFYKRVLAQTQDQVFTAGLGVALPTSDDFVISQQGAELVRIYADSTHLMPFFGWAFAPNDRLFMQTYVQYDFDLNGNRVRLFDAQVNGGRLQDAHFVFVDFSVGYWLFRNQSSTVQGLAPILEIHWDRSLNDTDVIRGETIQLGTPQTLQSLNITAGVTAQIGDDGALTIGYAAPVGGGDDQFDHELRVIFNWYFGQRGPSRNLRNVQF